MSQENVDAARGMWDAFNRRDLDAWLEGFDPEVEWHTAREDPDAGVHHGRSGVKRYAEQWLDAYDDLRVEPLEIVDAGDEVLVWIRVTGHGGASGVGVDMEQAQVLTFRDGRVAVGREYFDRAEAFEVAGLPAE
jgi:ketosteroid isomerase-like protein